MRMMESGSLPGSRSSVGLELIGRALVFCLMRRWSREYDRFLDVPCPLCW